MSLRPANYQEAKANHRPMKRNAPLKRAGFRKPALAPSKNEIASRKPIARKSPLSQRKGLKRKRISPEEKAWREAVLERDNHQCRWPTENESHHRGRLHAHHINERSQRPDLVYDVSNGAALCNFHHDYAHHSIMGRIRAKELGLLGGETYEAAQKKQCNR